MDDFETAYDTECSVCGHSPTRWRACPEPGCVDGWIDKFLDDQASRDPDRAVMCKVCHGTGIQQWCDNCGSDLSLTGFDFRRTKTAQTLPVVTGYYRPPAKPRPPEVAQAWWVWAAWIATWVIVILGIAAIFYLAFLKR